MLGRSTLLLVNVDIFDKIKYSSFLKFKSHLPRKCVDLPNIYQYIYQHLLTKRYIDVPWQVRDCRISLRS